MTLKANWSMSLFGPTVLLLLIVVPAAAQTSEQFWPKVKVAFDLQPKTGLEVYGEKLNGEELANTQWKIGVMGSYRMKRLVVPHPGGIDEDKNNAMTLGAGYEHSYTNNNGDTKTEN